MILAPWPIAMPLHGGQIRAGQIVQAYRAAGHDVLFVGLYDPRTTKPEEFTEADHAITPEVLTWLETVPGPAEMAFWRALADEPRSWARYRDQAAAFAPDLIQFEEPFLWPVVQKLAAPGALNWPRGRLCVAHSSLNVEHAWRRQYAATEQAGNAAAITQIEALEREVAHCADIVFVVSEADAAAFRAMGANHVVLAPNGSALPPPEQPALRTVRQYIDRQPFALFVSSAHPPNATGLMQMIREAPGVRLRNGILLVCGGVERLLRPHAAEPGLQHLFRDIRLLGRVPGELLAAFYARAHVALVPRTLGGGSNLKTAEALLSGRPIVATSRAFVGFEPFVRGPGIRIADEPRNFWTETDALLGEAAVPPIMRDGVEALAWSRTLAPMVKRAESMVEGRSGS